MVTPSKEIKTRGMVLKRTDYGEADRILNLITPEGKIAVIARGVRKARSKLAGSVEMFTLADYNIHIGRSELGVLTGAKMQHYYGGKIVKNYEKVELASLILKKVNVMAEGSDSPEFFGLVEQVMVALEGEVDLNLIEGWALLHLLKAVGEEMNLYRDVTGMPLESKWRYDWLVNEEGFSKNDNGEYGADEIKMLRLMMGMNLDVVQRVKVETGMIKRVLQLVRLKCA